MADETPAPDHAGPFRLTIPGEGSWLKPIPWIVEVPLFAILVYLVVTDPVATTHVVPALGVGATMLIVALPGLVQLSSTARAWAHRRASVDDDGIAVEMPGRANLRWAWSQVSRVQTRPISHGMQLPPVHVLVTDFYDRDGERIPELTVHHASYRAIVRTSEGNPEGAAFLGALEERPVAAVFDLATRALIDLVLRPENESLGALSDKTLEELRAGRLWHARRAADEDKRKADRIPDVLIRISYILGRHAQRTAREAAFERPDDPLVRYYVAHAILADIRTAATTRDPSGIRRRHRLRDEAHAILQGLRDDPAYGPAAIRDLESLESRAITREGEDLSGDGLVAGRPAAPDAPSVRAAQAAAERRAAREAMREKSDDEAAKLKAEREAARREAWRENLVLTPGRRAREEAAAAERRAAEREAARQHRQGILDPPSPKEGRLRRIVPRRGGSDGKR